MPKKFIDIDEKEFWKTFKQSPIIEPMTKDTSVVTFIYQGNENKRM